MTLMTLTTQERGGLEDLATRTLHAGERRRAQALLWLDAGESVQEVAGRLRVRTNTALVQKSGGTADSIGCAPAYIGFGKSRCLSQRATMRPRPLREPMP
jgi:hypothetical protein